MAWQTSLVGLEGSFIQVGLGTASFSSVDLWETCASFQLVL